MMSSNGTHGVDRTPSVRGYFDPSRPAFRQNQFGGTLGGPVKRQKAYFFGDYQGTRTNEGVETGLISVPSTQDRAGYSVSRAFGRNHVRPAAFRLQLSFARAAAVCDSVHQR
jgi:hypothetical protein